MRTGAGSLLFSTFHRGGGRQRCVDGVHRWGGSGVVLALRNGGVEALLNGRTSVQGKVNSTVTTRGGLRHGLFHHDNARDGLLTISTRGRKTPTAIAAGGGVAADFDLGSVNAEVTRTMREKRWLQCRDCGSQGSQEKRGYRGTRFTRRTDEAVNGTG